MEGHKKYYKIKDQKKTCIRKDVCNLTFEVFLSFETDKTSYYVGSRTTYQSLTINKQPTTNFSDIFISTFYYRLTYLLLILSCIKRYI